jgi:hypothetical protein
MNSLYLKEKEFFEYVRRTNLFRIRGVFDPE